MPAQKLFGDRTDLLKNYCVCCSRSDLVKVIKLIEKSTTNRCWREELGSRTRPRRDPSGKPFSVASDADRILRSIFG